MRPLNSFYESRISCYREIKTTFSDPNSWKPYIAETGLPIDMETGTIAKADTEGYDFTKSGDVKLILAIFDQCLHDISKAPEAKPSHIKRYRVNSWRFHSAEAQLFMNVNNPALINYCSYLPVSPEKIVTIFNSYLYKLRRGIKCTA